MNKIKLEAYTVLYDEGTFSLWTENKWAELYAVAMPRTKVTGRYSFQIPFAKAAYDYGYSIMTNKKIYQEELSSVSKHWAWYLLNYGKTKSLLESDSRI